MLDAEKFKGKTVTESQFYMWRTLFAMSHADNDVSASEIRFMSEALEDIPFTQEQKAILKEDINQPQDIIQMFSAISDVRDQAEFFSFARTMVWVDGDFGKAEQDIMLKLQKMHIQNADIDKLVGNINLELTDIYDHSPAKVGSEPARASDRKKIIFSFRKKFLEGLS
jgi:hypothetical protein